jgi:beta-glucanase (GH16 family)
LRIPVVSSLAMNAARSLITPHETLLDLDMTQWHDYALDWLTNESVFSVDGKEVMRAAKPPQVALGFAAWVDNYRATATPDGQYEFAYVDVPEPQWMELVFQTDKN